MFADDTKNYSVIKSFDDTLRLQDGIDRLMKWSSIWLLRFNAAKCQIMQFGNSILTTYTMRDPSLNVSTTLDVVTEEKDLGVWCTSDLKPSLHCRKVAVKASQTLSLIRRTFKINSAEMFLFLHKMYVWPHLEYCVQSWSPYLARDIDILEKVQRRATKHVYGLNSLPYKCCLEKLQLIILQTSKR